MVVPEGDLLGNLTELRVWILGITFIVLTGAILRAVAVVGRFSQPIEALVRQSERISRGNLEPGPAIESALKEVRLLAQTQERMRQGLQTLMKLESDL